MTLERLNALHATFLAVEDAVYHLHVGSIDVFEGPPPDLADWRAAIAP